MGPRATRSPTSRSSVANAASCSTHRTRRACMRRERGATRPSQPHDLSGRSGRGALFTGGAEEASFTGGAEEELHSRCKCSRRLDECAACKGYMYDLSTAALFGAVGLGVQGRGFKKADGPCVEGRGRRGAGHTHGYTSTPPCHMAGAPGRRCVGRGCAVVGRRTRNSAYRTATGDLWVIRRPARRRGPARGPLARVAR